MKWSRIYNAFFNSELYIVYLQYLVWCRYTEDMRESYQTASTKTLIPGVKILPGSQSKLGRFNKLWWFLDDRY